MIAAFEKLGEVEKVNEVKELLTIATPQG